MLASTIKVPRLRLKDGDCGLSWFEGDDTFSAAASTGEYPNRGSLGSASSLNMGTDTTAFRVGVPGLLKGNVPLFKPDVNPHGTSTAETSTGESSAGTLECWVRLDVNIASTYFLHKVYHTGTAAWSTPFMTIGLGFSSGYATVWYSESGSAVTAVSTSGYALGILLGSWYHLAVTWSNGSPINIYINGVLVRSTANATLDWGQHGRWAAGGRGGRGDSSSGLNSEGMTGLLQGARVHQVARSSAWMADTFKVGRGLL